MGDSAAFVDDDGPALIDIDIRGQASGSASDLARFVVQDVRGVAGATLRMLYLTGDRNRDVVMRVLAEGGVGLETLRVYDTRESPQFETRLSLVLEVAPKGAPASFSFSLFFVVLTDHSRFYALVDRLLFTVNRGLRDAHSCKILPLTQFWNNRRIGKPDSCQDRSDRTDYA